MNYIEWFLCIALGLVTAIQCFVVAIKMPPTAKPYLKVLVGGSSFLSVAVTAVALGSPSTSHASIALLCILCVFFGWLLRRWKYGMPSQHDTKPAPLTEQL